MRNSETDLTNCTYLLELINNHVKVLFRSENNNRTFIKDIETFHKQSESIRIDSENIDLDESSKLFIDSTNFKIERVFTISNSEKSIKEINNVINRITGVIMTDYVLFDNDNPQNNLEIISRIKFTQSNVLFLYRLLPNAITWIFHIFYDMVTKINLIDYRLNQTLNVFFIGAEKDYVHFKDFDSSIIKFHFIDIPAEVSSIIFFSKLSSSLFKYKCLTFPDFYINNQIIQTYQSLNIVQNLRGAFQKYAEMTKDNFVVMFELNKELIMFSSINKVTMFEIFSIYNLQKELLDYINKNNLDNENSFENILLNSIINETNLNFENPAIEFDYFTQLSIFAFNKFFSVYESDNSNFKKILHLGDQKKGKRIYVADSSKIHLFDINEIIIGGDFFENLDREHIFEYISSFFEFGGITKILKLDSNNFLIESIENEICDLELYLKNSGFLLTPIMNFKKETKILSIEEVTSNNKLGYQSGEDYFLSEGKYRFSIENSKLFGIHSNYFEIESNCSILINLKLKPIVNSTQIYENLKNIYPTITKFNKEYFPKMNKHNFDINYELKSNSISLVEKGDFVNEDTAIFENINILSSTRIINIGSYVSSKFEKDSLLINENDLIEKNQTIYKSKHGNVASRYRGIVKQIFSSGMIVIEEQNIYAFEPVILNVAKKLVINPKNIHVYLNFHMGDYVETGNILAKRGFQGNNSVFYSPCHGYISEINKDGTVVLFFEKKAKKVQSSIKGMVKEIIDKERIILTGEGTVINCFMGIGESAFGKLVILNDNSDLKNFGRNNIVYVNRTFDYDIFIELQKRKVNGIIVSFCDFQVLKNIYTLNCLSDIWNKSKDFPTLFILNNFIEQKIDIEIQEYLYSRVSSIISIFPNNGFFESKIFFSKDIFTESVVEKRTEELYKKYTDINEANQHILESIQYASLIQNSILPRNEELSQYIKKYFIIWKPKDIVGGDFYWFFPIPNSKNYIISEIDCTGHGVPGAFMSMTANSILNNIVREKKIYEPDKILNLLHKEIRYTLRQQSREAQQDGMDISICYIDVTLQEIYFSGAMQHLYLLKKGKKEKRKKGKREGKKGDRKREIGNREKKIERILGNRFSIGGRQKEEERIFTKHTIHYNSGDNVYLLSDGLADQKVRIDDKETRLKIKRVKEILLKYCSLPMNEQKEKIEEELAKLQGELEQRDDITVLGIRLI
ncbi:MAG: SpoIIE family protein phosphatase [Candidatus Cloacimonetes bacterium]|nr:SpoIIE family protein phosphatase [Candidatus Cloacimonadota bacterium]